MSKSESELLWYIMPFAEAYIPRKFTIDRRLKQMVEYANRALARIKRVSESAKNNSSDAGDFFNSGRPYILWNAQRYARRATLGRLSDSREDYYGS